MENALKIFRSSAGSGKTFALVREYLRIVLHNPADYKHTLAITFTNKATAEMKRRILDSLVILSEDKPSSLKTLFVEEGLSGLEERARKALDLILHDYSSFTVCTIDSFFQKIIRGIAREINLPANLQLELNEDDVKEEIVDTLFDDVGQDAELRKWLTELIEQKLFRDGRWEVRQDLLVIAGELFKSRHDDKEPFDRKQIRHFHKQLHEICTAFASRMQSLGKQGMETMAVEGVTEDDFSNKTRGPAGYFQKIANASNDPGKYMPNATQRAAAGDASKWVTKTSPQKQRLLALVEGRLQPLLQRAVEACDDGYPRYLSAVIILRRIYLLGLLNDLTKKLAQYRRENNLMMLSDTPRILNRFIRDNDASFVFEKTGLQFRYCLIDEFQDTSAIQWKNLLPLVVNALASGHMTMVVGDAKQSIYRWRGGNIHLLGGELQRDLANFRSLTVEVNLDTNYRSRRDVVAFNNAFFSALPVTLAQRYPEMDTAALQRFYAEGLVQKTASKNETAGYVRLKFLEKKKGHTEDAGWQDTALNEMLETIHQLRAKGYAYGDIALLVRKNKEGNTAATFLASHGITQVVSSDSLLLKSHPKIIFLINALRCLADPANNIARSLLLNSWMQLSAGTAEPVDPHLLFTDHSTARKRKVSGASPGLFDVAAFDNNLFNSFLPPRFTGRLGTLSRLPVYSAAEELVQAFGFHDTPDAYVERFLDAVLEFSTRHQPSQIRFLQWWDESRQAETCSVVTPEAGDAIRIVTIHKAKGLQFPVVLMPFCDWDFHPSPKDLLWVHTPEEPFRDFGELPVHPVKDLEDSLFKTSYHNEIVHALTDNINLLYVSFTRAEQQLYAWCPSGAADKQGSSFIAHMISQAPDLAPSYDAESGLLTMGDPGLRQETKPPSATAHYRAGYKAASWNEKIVLAARAREFSGMGEERKHAVSHGLVIHAVLAQVTDSTRLDEALDRFVFEGLVAAEEMPLLRQRLHELLQVPSIARFFQPGRKVLNEREILLPGGERFRPDRVVLDGNAADILDFKTGAEDDAHRQQLQRYASILHRMGYEPVRAWVLYTRTASLHPVEYDKESS